MYTCSSERWQSSSRPPGDITLADTRRTRDVELIRQRERDVQSSVEQVDVGVVARFPIVGKCMHVSETPTVDVIERVHVRVCLLVCVCVCVREREKERKKERKREREYYVCACVCV